MRAVLGLYDALGRQWSHRRHSREQLAAGSPDLAQEGLTASYSYRDAQTDDARLTLRVLSEAVRAGGVALNYVRATGLLRAGRRVIGVGLRDEQGRTSAAHTRVVVNATGAWADRLPAHEDGVARIRPLRGSHLVIDAGRLPLDRAINFHHPAGGSTCRSHRPLEALSRTPSACPRADLPGTGEGRRPAPCRRCARGRGRR